MKGFVIGGYDINSYLLLLIFLGLGGVTALFLSMSNSSPAFTEELCTKNLQLPEDFFQKASYQKRVLNVNIDRTPSRGVVWNIYSAGKLSDRYLVEDVKLSSQVAYTVISDKEFQGCGKLIAGSDTSIPASAIMMKCPNAEVFTVEDSTTSYFSVQDFLKSGTAKIESLILVSKRWQDGMKTFLTTLHSSSGCA